MQHRDRRDLGAFIPKELDDMGLDPYVFRVYARICRRAGAGACFESAPNMAQACQMSERKVRDAIDTLVDRKLVAVTERAGRTSVITLEPLHVVQPPLHTVQDTPAHGADEGTTSKGIPSKTARKRWKNQPADTPIPQPPPFDPDEQPAHTDVRTDELGRAYVTRP